MSSATLSSVASPTPGIFSPTNMFYFLLVPALTLFYIYWKVSRRHMIELADKIPGPPGLPIIGNALEFIGSPNDIFNNFYQRSFEFGRTVKVWAGPRLLIFLTDPRDVEVILSSHVHIDKSPEYRFFKPWLGDGLLISTGQKWRAHRKLIAPTFHLNVLKSFIDLFNKNSRETVKKLEKELGKEFDCHDYMSEATVEILLETAMGVSKKTQDQSGYDYAMAVMKLCDILHMRHTKVWFRPDIIFNLTNTAKYQKKLINVIHSLTRKVIQKKKADFEQGIRGSTAEVPEELKTQKYEKNISTKATTLEGTSYGQSVGLKDDLDVDDDVGEKKRMAFLDLMIEASQNGVVINDEEIKEQVDTIMFEGHDTTAAGSSFFLCQMAAHPDIQEKVIQEVDEIFQGSDRPATFADTLEMKYLERCLLETLRMFPPVPIIARQLQQDVKLASNPDHVLPAGATIVIGTFKVHRLEEIYGPNPDKFDPDNFLPEKAANRHYYGFIPFSAGPRSCVGRKYAMLKLKILLSTIMRNFRVKSNLKEADYKLQGDIILKRSDGFKIMLEKRKPTVTAKA
ncbi:cytochrome P450 4g15-like [Anthonomus grandis grandis]|uniref:cytochrome P450 4g15-like n=1 Tax=Anthonomus grandis grandis TaxID=2921223 RepID=UPI002165F804|nr:cytochrome P450 4g15-like [Anthonomus grandis grandis]XP_050303111.1 cytochrome P450 4g15-like [Anthonomus grandis grandis]XP_050303112.1 cytochrome P450 4g15-like [Anthonomus grandis grandis]